ncbi:unnamed protein product, partial [Vitis vinifera]|uniref:Uncharacterized protein n=1 Tax=Vitis vinifera TaxID=29760 RepID=D7TKR9_VITVI
MSDVLLYVSENFLHMQSCATTAFPFPSSILSARKLSCHHQTVGSLQPLKLVSITKRPTNRFIEEINLFPCNLIPNSNPILIASTFTTSKNPII